MMENQAELTKTRDAELTQAIEKIVRKRELKGDKIIFKNDEDFARAGMSILKKYNATENEKTWFLGLV
jgi:L-lactate utilization protein LutC